MKDFISKVTFSFLMAQLVPGMVVVMAFTCIATSGGSEADVCLETMLTRIEGWWFASAFRTVAFLFMSCAVGMLIHALNWTVLAWVENRDGIDDPKPVRETRYHRLPLWTQLLIGPLVMAYEVLTLVLKAPNLARLTMGENLKCFKQDCEWRFQFLQEFYLHFGQFYAHTAYALLLTTVLCVVNILRRPCLINFTVTIIAYLLTSVLFLFGRVQLGTLFRAETELAEHEHQKGEGPTE
ncbi:MAG: hypothetical protein RBS72_02630 [Sedimentisphaerales bacterium]|jgi:hypothetical protein|nr:hypothetical protein [Sedimentisphaerales bacterium]HNY77262.1 hypothetical protein [Sedimentisphaerales bacterium]HOC62134.1 hypothetical protein [Sedimentisphaerales bacterium]HOH63479.1 hypothetical protein [Sedimentisphaerales bacterium]HPY51184.1 hypothetical protein [Sedimentisphaerales bacterium]